MLLVARFVFGSEERANNNQKQNTGPFQRGAEASSRSKRNKWGVARRGGLFMPDLSLNSLEQSATGLRLLATESCGAPNGWIWRV